MAMASLGFFSLQIPADKKHHTLNDRPPNENQIWLILSTLINYTQSNTNWEKSFLLLLFGLQKTSPAQIKPHNALWTQPEQSVPVYNKITEIWMISSPSTILISHVYLIMQFWFLSYLPSLFHHHCRCRPAVDHGEQENKSLQRMCGLSVASHAHPSRCPTHKRSYLYWLKRADWGADRQGHLKRCSRSILYWQC